MHALYRNHMGNDLEVVQDARISFDKSSKPVGWETICIKHPCPSTHPVMVKTDIPILSQADQNLIGFLARGCRSGEWDKALDTLRAQAHGMTQAQVEGILLWVKKMPTHWTPFGQQVIKLRMKAPVPIRTQCFKSKIGMVENEESRRYISSTPELFVPEFRSAPDGDIKQGSGGTHMRNRTWQRVYTQQCKEALKIYEEMIEDYVAPEQARFVLPQGVYVNWVWTGSLYAFAEFFNKRQDGHAQGEIQELAQAVAEVVAPLFPVSWAALTDG